MGGIQYENKSQVAATSIGLIISFSIVFFPIFTFSKIMSNFDKLKTKEFQDTYGVLIESTKV